MPPENQRIDELVEWTNGNKDLSELDSISQSDLEYGLRSGGSTTTKTLPRDSIEFISFDEFIERLESGQTNIKALDDATASQNSAATQSVIVA